MADADVDEVMRHFEEMSRVAHLPVIRALRERALGSSIGGTSYTTHAQVVDLVERLALAPARRVLEVGAGTGWPGLLLAELSGCEVVLTDPSSASLQIARRLAAERGIAVPQTAVADGAALPFGPECFDAVTHSDVLC